MSRRRSPGTSRPSSTTTASSAISLTARFGRCSGAALLASNEAAAAIPHLQQAIDLRPSYPDAHFNLARLCEARGLRQEAVRHLSAFRKLTGER